MRSESMNMLGATDRPNDDGAKRGVVAIEDALGADASVQPPNAQTPDARGSVPVLVQSRPSKDTDLPPLPPTSLSTSRTPLANSRMRQSNTRPQEPRISTNAAPLIPKDADLPPLPTASAAPSHTAAAQKSGSGPGLFKRLTTKLRSNAAPPVASPSSPTDNTRGSATPTVSKPKRKSSDKLHCALGGLFPPYLRSVKDAHGYRVPLSEQEAELDRRFTVVVEDQHSDSEQESESKRIMEAWLTRNREGRPLPRSGCRRRSREGVRTEERLGEDVTVGQSTSPSRATFVEAHSPPPLSPSRAAIADPNEPPQSPTMSSSSVERSDTEEGAAVPSSSSSSVRSPVRAKKEKPSPIIVTTVAHDPSGESTKAGDSQRRTLPSSPSRGRSVTVSHPHSLRENTAAPSALAPSTSTSTVSGSGRSRSTTLPALSPTRTLSSEAASISLPTPTTTCEPSMSGASSDSCSRPRRSKGAGLKDLGLRVQTAGVVQTSVIVESPVEEAPISEMQEFGAEPVRHQVRTGEQVEAEERKKSGTLGLFGRKLHVDENVRTARTSSSMSNLRRTITGTFSSMRPKSTMEASGADSRRGAKLPGISLPPSSYNFPSQPSVRPPDRSRTVGAGLREPRQGLLAPRAIFFRLSGLVWACDLSSDYLLREQVVFRGLDKKHSLIIGWHSGYHSTESGSHIASEPSRCSVESDSRPRPFAVERVGGRECRVSWSEEAGVTKEWRDLPSAVPEGGKAAPSTNSWTGKVTAWLGQMFLPTNYPHSVHRSYAPFHILQFFETNLSTVVSVLCNQALLTSVGMARPSEGADVVRGVIVALGSGLQIATLLITPSAANFLLCAAGGNIFKLVGNAIWFTTHIKFVRYFSQQGIQEMLLPRTSHRLLSHNCIFFLAVPVHLSITTWMMRVATFELLTQPRLSWLAREYVQDNDVLSLEEMEADKSTGLFGEFYKHKEDKYLSLAPRLTEVIGSDTDRSRERWEACTEVFMNQKYLLYPERRYAPRHATRRALAHDAPERSSLAVNSASTWDEEVSLQSTLADSLAWTEQKFDSFKRALEKKGWRTDEIGFADQGQRVLWGPMADRGGS
ncbi:hypothetical protein A0H81_07685 [Grifola frondosa]|uniref:Protein root UVB sensitive/RUS domain-containing protein n=1 Tax=Grifola frondosa TaxID=5627 RepID=A0A1C7MCC5_GRIFR|nr:hypothetical protein A0H81_07685 [Grifola frondosa]